MKFIFKILPRSFCTYCATFSLLSLAAQRCELILERRDRLVSFLQ
tara:strand:- start:186 stop:320 length:135 start_codon:yes stop_codon:yes gene_type:complete